jgi:hypothetical protein
MPAKTLVQVEFKAPDPPAPAPTPAPDQTNDGSGNKKDSSNNNSNSNEQDNNTTTALAVDASDNKQQDQINRDGSIEGVRTGDDTPLTALIMLFLAFALCFSAVFGKYMRIKPGKK